MNVALAIAVVTIVAALLVQGRRGKSVRTTRLRLLIPGLPRGLHGFRIAFVSDLHVGKLYASREHLIAAVGDAEPDLLLLGGDYVNTRLHNQSALELLGTLSAGHPTYAVPGNADIRQRLDMEALSALLADTGGALLMNDVGTLDAGGSRLEVLGIDDTKDERADPAATLEMADPDAHVRIGLTHSPAQWQDLATLKAHISLCGHTHGGQIRVPGLEAPVVHGNYPRMIASGLFRFTDGAETDLERVAGHWRLLARGNRRLDVPTRDGPLLYVSRGVGVGWIPMRLFCPPEVLLIDLEADEMNGSDPHDG